MDATWPAVRDMRPLAQVRDLACSDSRPRHAPGMAMGENGAQERTRTSTPLRAPAPEAGASTNSATWARGRRRELRAGGVLVNARLEPLDPRRQGRQDRGELRLVIAPFADAAGVEAADQLRPARRRDVAAGGMGGEVAQPVGPAD